MHVNVIQTSFYNHTNGTVLIQGAFVQFSRINFLSLIYRNAVHNLLLRHHTIIQYTCTTPWEYYMTCKGVCAYLYYIVRYWICYTSVVILCQL